MPRFTIDLSKKAVAKLNLQVKRTNDSQGTKYTLAEWISLHLREVAVADDMTAAFEQLRTESEQLLATAVAAKRDQLLQELESA